jgi:hypothetical protein
VPFHWPQFDSSNLQLYFAVRSLKSKIAVFNNHSLGNNGIYKTIICTLLQKGSMLKERVAIRHHANDEMAPVASQLVQK